MNIIFDKNEKVIFRHNSHKTPNSKVNTPQPAFSCEKPTYHMNTVCYMHHKNSWHIKKCIVFPQKRKKKKKYHG